MPLSRRDADFLLISGIWEDSLLKRVDFRACRRTDESPFVRFSRKGFRIGLEHYEKLRNEVLSFSKDKTDDQVIIVASKRRDLVLQRLNEGATLDIRYFNHQSEVFEKRGIRLRGVDAVSFRFVIQMLETPISQETWPSLSNFRPPEFRPLSIPIDQPAQMATAEMLEDIRSSLSDSLDNSPIDRSHIEGLIRILSCSNLEWEKSLAAVASDFLFILDNINLPASVRNEVLSALLYLAEINDVIPDHIVGSGLLDDAFAFSLIQRRIETFYPITCADIIKILGERN